MGKVCFRDGHSWTKTLLSPSEVSSGLRVRNVSPFFVVTYCISSCKQVRVLCIIPRLRTTDDSGAEKGFKGVGANPGSDGFIIDAKNTEMPRSDGCLPFNLPSFPPF